MKKFFLVLSISLVFVSCSEYISRDVIDNIIVEVTDAYLNDGTLLETEVMSEYRSFSTLTDLDGIILDHPDIELIGESIADFGIDELVEASEKLYSLEEGNSFEITYTFNGIDKLMYFERVPDDKVLSVNITVGD